MSGLLFEDYCIQVLENRKEYKSSSARDDKHKGTDFFWNRLPVDVTLNPNKTFVERLGSIDLGCSTIIVGRRTRNEHIVFNEPTLVLLFIKKVGSYRFIAGELTGKVIEAAIDIFWAEDEEAG